MCPRRPSQAEEAEAEAGSDDDEGVYSGGLNARGEPHGRGSLLFASGACFMGHFADGVKHGPGRWRFDGGDELRGRWQHGVLQGRAAYFSADDGSLVEGEWRDDLCHGPARELGAAGDVRFEGTYRRGARHGPGRLHLAGGGCLQGAWVDGELSDDAARFAYPDGSTLRGRWHRGRMLAATYHSADGARLAPHVYRHDPSTAARISSEPLLADPYEARTVRVAPSTIPGAGEGLFTRRAVPAGQVLAYYNGVRLTHRIVDRRGWSANSNTISLDDDTVLDVPAEHASTARYVASLGHKANHRLPNNAEYAPCLHPRFGHIKCVRAVRALAAGEEVTVDYGYSDERPPWYRDAPPAPKRARRTHAT